jgi:hypothetical protein
MEEEPPRTNQHKLQQVRDDRELRLLKEETNDVGRLRLSSLELRGTSGFYTALPSEALRLKVPPQEFQTALRLRLGMDQPNGPRMDDPKGHRALSTTGRYSIGRHNEVRSVVHAACKVFDRQARIEQRGPDETRADRPGDVWTRGLRPFGTQSFIDVTVTNPLQTTLFKIAGIDGERAVELREEAKHRGEGAKAVKEAGQHFQPIAANALGGFSQESLKALRLITTRVCSHSGRQYAREFHQLLERLSMAINRGSAQMVLSRLAPGTAAEVLQLSGE